MTDLEEAKRPYTPRTDALEAQMKVLEAKLEKLESLSYEERARALHREAELSKEAATQQLQIDHMKASRDNFHSTVGRWVERIVFGMIAAAGWFWDRLSGS